MIQDIYKQQFSLELTQYYNVSDYDENNFTFYDRIPFTYLLGWSKSNMFYYGVRYAKNCLPTQLFTKYFTSSNIVKQYIVDEGVPDTIIIDKIFKNSNAAREYECLFLKFYKATTHENFLNKTNGDGKFYNNATYNHNKKLKPVSEEAKLKMSNSRKGKNFTQKHKDNISKGLIGHHVSIESREKISLGHLGRKHSDEHKEKNRIQQLGNNYAKGTKRSSEIRALMSELLKNKPKILCPHCNRLFDHGNYAQYHGEKCFNLTGIRHKKRK